MTRASGARQFRRIVHPTDFSRASDPAFRRALGLAAESGAELYLVHVIEPRGLELGKAYRTRETFEAIARREARDQLARAVRRAEQAGVRARPLVAEGRAWDAIVRTARQLRADLIVVGTHGRSGLSKAFLGSVAERVIAAAPCPVMTIPGRGGARSR
jgi:universal stress protein A